MAAPASTKQVVAATEKPENSTLLSRKDPAVAAADRKKGGVGSRSSGKGCKGGDIGKKQGAAAESPQTQGVAPLTESQVDAFRNVFQFFDVDGGGTISCMEMYERSQELGLGLTLEQVIVAMKDVCPGREDSVAFDDFLQYMTSNQKYARAIKASQDNLPHEAGLFLAVTKYIEQGNKSSHTELLEKYFLDKAKGYLPHVIGDFAATWRLTGLSVKQLNEYFKKLVFEKPEHGAANSPYALKFCAKLFTETEAERKRKKKPVKKRKPSTAPALQQRAQQPKVCTPHKKKELPVAKVEQKDYMRGSSHIVSAVTTSSQSLPAEKKPAKSRYHRRSFSLPMLHVRKPRFSVTHLKEVRELVEEVQHDFVEAQTKRNVSDFDKVWRDTQANRIKSEHLKERLRDTFKTYTSHSPHIRSY